MGKTIFITGGARSGKSTYAEQLAAENSGEVLYLATAKPIDEEMADRIRRHKEQRPEEWAVIEGYHGIGEIIAGHHDWYDVLLLDCVTVMTTNIMFDNPDIFSDNITVPVMNAVEDMVMKEIDAIIDTFNKIDCTLIMVSNEVGLGLVPETPLSRFFRDVQGRVNQRLAKASDEVYFVVCGIPQKIKG